MEYDTEEGERALLLLCASGPRRPAAAGGRMRFPDPRGFVSEQLALHKLRGNYHVRAIRVEEIKMQAMTLDRRSSLVVDLGGQISTARTHRSGLTPAPDYRRRGATLISRIVPPLLLGGCVLTHRRGAIGRSAWAPVAACVRSAGRISAPSAAPFHRRRRAHARPAVLHVSSCTQGEAEVAGHRGLPRASRASSPPRWRYRS